MSEIFINYVLYFQSKKVDAEALFAKHNTGELKLLKSAEEAADSPGVLLIPKSIRKQPLPPLRRYTFYRPNVWRWNRQRFRIAGHPEHDEGTFVLRLVDAQTWSAFWKTAVLSESTADVAADLAMTPAAVRKAKSRTIQRLRKQLGDRE